MRPSLMGLGNRPDRTPAHHVDFEQGMGPRGPKIALILTYPSSGSRLNCTVACGRASSFGKPIGYRPFLLQLIDGCALYAASHRRWPALTEHGSSPESPYGHG